MSPGQIRLRGATKFRGKLAARIGWEVQRSRTALGLNQREAAKHCEVPLQRFIEIEEGLAVTASISTIERIADLLKLDWETVFVKRPDDAI